MSYTQIWDPMNNRPHETIIRRDSDGAFIPFDLGNRDYQAYLAWIDAGNQPAIATGPQTTPASPAQPAPYRQPNFEP
jgi:hypothetical protein